VGQAANTHRLDLIKAFAEAAYPTVRCPLSQPCLDHRRAPIDVLPDITFPDNADAPAKLAECSHVSRISIHVRPELLLPEFWTRCRDRCEAATGMTMPEASMNHDGSHSARKDDIRPARQACAVQPEPQPQSMKRLPQTDFGLRVCSPDPSHHARAGRTIHNVSQSLSWRITSKSLESVSTLSEDSHECREISR
jgi:hypothetical protein